MLIAAGLDPERCILFRQSDVPEHTELTWLLSSVTPLGELNRMHQFRDKSGAQRELVSLGLLFYPVLQAADVLAYRAHEVPVGEDQREHLELMRDVARALQRPLRRAAGGARGTGSPTVGARVRDLQEPERKMSTTGGTEQGTVYVLDEPDTIRRKFKRAVTDSGREIVRADDKPGISNLIEILAVVRGVAPEEIEREFEGSGYGDFKAAVAEAVVEWLAPVRERYDELRGRRGARSRRSSRPAPRRRARSPRRDAGGRARGDGRRPGPAVRRARRLAFRSAWRTIAHRLELDLDVFAGPFDLLLSLILREELDLLEVELAEIVVAYLDHLEAGASSTSRRRPSSWC